jgi:hypothetical protein
MCVTWTPTGCVAGGRLRTRTTNESYRTALNPEAPALSPEAGPSRGTPLTWRPYEASVNARLRRR